MKPYKGKRVSFRTKLEKTSKKKLTRLFYLQLFHFVRNSRSGLKLSNRSYWNACGLVSFILYGILATDVVFRRWCNTFCMGYGSFFNWWHNSAILPLLHTCKSRLKWNWWVTKFQFRRNLLLIFHPVSFFTVYKFQMDGLCGIFNRNKHQSLRKRVSFCTGFSLKTLYFQ